MEYTCENVDAEALLQILGKSTVTGKVDPHQARPIRRLLVRLPLLDLSKLSIFRSGSRHGSL